MILKRNYLHFRASKPNINFIDISVKPEEYIHVTHIDDQSYDCEKKDIVLIHGLSASSVVYFKIFKRLAKYFRIYAIDLPGQGLSSRHNHNFSSIQEAEDFFVERLNTTFNVLKLTKFVLVGHSFGGYCSSLFTTHHPEMVERLILLSPVGISSNYTEIVSTKLEDFLQSVFFKQQKAPNSVYKMMGPLANYFFNKICDRKKFRGLKDDTEFFVYRDFLNCLFRNQSCSEKAIFQFFDKNLRAFKPITYYAEFLKDVKILFLYGDIDWCPSRHAQDLRDLIPDNVEIDTVSDSGHLLYNDNYDELVEKMLAYLSREGVIEADEYNSEKVSPGDIDCIKGDMEELQTKSFVVENI